MKKTAFMIIMAISVFAVSCKKDSDDENGNNNPVTLNIRLTDAPGAYDAVNIDIRSVSINVDSGWFDFDLQDPGIYDLISLSNGNSALLVSNASVPPGTIHQMRLHLGDSNTIVVDGTVHDLKTPSGQSSGYKVKINAPIAPGGVYQVLIDFDAEKSIVEQGNGGYLLKPVVYGNLVTAIGQIDGTVFPASGGSLATAWNATDTFNVFIDPQTGFFLINSLFPGNYNVKITAIQPYADTTITGVPVVAAQVTHLDSIMLSQ